jgi:hypothetical protein
LPLTLDKLRLTTLAGESVLPQRVGRTPKARLSASMTAVETGVFDRDSAWVVRLGVRHCLFILNVFLVFGCFCGSYVGKV